MSTLTISMPDSLREFVNQRVATSGYGNTSEYVRELVRRDREAIARAQLEAELLKGVNSPTARELRVDQLAAYAKERTDAFFARQENAKSSAVRQASKKAGVQ